jgi:hypothetical protein
VIPRADRTAQGPLARITRRGSRAFVAALRRLGAPSLATATRWTSRGLAAMADVRDIVIPERLRRAILGQRRARAARAIARLARRTGRRVLARGLA